MPNDTNPVFAGNFELLLDEKNRLLIPASVRRKIPDSMGLDLCITPGINKWPWIWPAGVYYGMARSLLPSGPMPEEEIMELIQAMFSLADEQTMDKQGRIVLSQDSIDRAGLGREVMLVGAYDHLELWDRAVWTAHRKEKLEPRVSDIYSRARSALRAQQSAASRSPGGLTHGV